MFYRLLVKIIEEGGDACEGGLACVLDLDGELNLRLCHAAEVLDRMEVGNETDALTREDCLTKLHLVHAIVDHHLKVVDLDDLIPHVGEHRESEVTVGDGRLERTLHSGTLGVDMNPLVVEGGIGKLVNTFLGQLYPLAHAEVLAKISGKLIVVVDY